MLCAAMIFTTVTTLLRHLARSQKLKTNLRSHDLKNIGKETSIYKSEGNFSHIRKLLMTCVILA